MKQDFENKIFADNNICDHLILKLFEFQFNENEIYNTWCRNLNKTPDNVKSINEIPFLPVSFFKTHKVVSGNFNEEKIFESSGTTKTVNSKHYVKSLQLYEKSFMHTFQQFYGDISEYCILALLPSYLERENSSLIYMTDVLIHKSKNELSGYYLYNIDHLADNLKKLEENKQKTILFGVTFALLDFAKKFTFPLKHTIIMDTGGMKGRRRELTRNEVHDILKSSFSVSNIHSEYGMTELLSQAYSFGNGIYHTPSYLKILLRDESDPLSIQSQGRGLINVIDLANIYSCSFLATDDVGTVYADGTFSIWGRRDDSDLRGCSLMVV